MNSSTAATGDTQSYFNAANSPTASSSAVSWAAIAAGAVGAAALSLILFILGTGLGLSSVSPWENDGIRASSLGWGAIAWIAFTQLAASAMGGYLAGRLRARWTATHLDEIYFRDTAHGFLAWAAASLLTAALFTTAISSVVGTGVQTAATAAGGAATVAAMNAPEGMGRAPAISDTQPTGAPGLPLTYLVESLFRAEAPGESPGADAPPVRPAPTPEVGRIYATALRSGSLPPQDLSYIAQLVSQRTGLAAVEAERRVTDAFTRLQDAKTRVTEAADKARKASSYAALWLFIALLMGAFIASWTATLGGRQRDL